MTTESIETRVARGAAWLDRVRPGWRDSITPSDLLMHDGCHCICGQVFADTAPNGFHYAIDIYSDHDDWDINHGFTNTSTPDGRIERWADLEAEWHRVIGVTTASAAHV